VVDPADTSLVAWQLRHGAYAEIARVVGDEAVVADRPFATRITPGDLVD
jgi:hypothetical protein